MKMKAKHALLLIAVGYCLQFLGAYFKIVHRGSANFLLLAAMILKVAGVVLLCWKLIRYPGLHKFLES
jgi:hypothetical protein